MNSSYRTWLLTSCGSILFVLFVTGGDVSMAVTTAVLAVLAGLAWAWYLTKGPGALVQSLKRLWLELPGASVASGLVMVHHGTQPLWVRCGSRDRVLTVSIHTPLPVSAVAFRVWPKTASTPPSMGPLGQLHGGPPVERAVLLEMRFANTLNVESSDEGATDRLISEEVALAFLDAREQSPRGFAGVSYDGQHLGVYLQGSIAADPEQATALAKSIWQTLA